MAYDVIDAGWTTWLSDASTDPRVSVGRYTYYDGPIRFGLWYDNHRIEIGQFSWIARDVLIFGGGNHPSRIVSAFDFSKIFPEAEHYRSGTVEERATVIGNDVWIGYGATILPGAQIGDGAMIGAQAVVSGRVEPYSVVAGNPAKLIRKRFSDHTIARLVALRWWDMDIDLIRSNLGSIYSDPEAWPSGTAFP